MWTNKKLKWTAGFAAFALIFQTNIIAAPLTVEEGMEISSHSKPLSDVADTSAPASDWVPGDPTVNFLSQTLLLLDDEPEAESSSDEAHKDRITESDADELVWQDFDTALELLRPEFAAAVIVENLSAKNIQDLLETGVEVGIALLEGEIVLFTSGNKNELLVNEPVRRLAEKADLMAHTHPFGYQTQGPSEIDLNHASGAGEYVLTQKGVFQYDHSGILGELDYDEFAFELMKKKQAFRASGRYADSISARNILNEFIAAIDTLNRIDESEKSVFRKGGDVPDYTDDFNRSGLGTDWQALSGGWSVYNNKLYHGSMGAGNNILAYQSAGIEPDYEVSATFYYNDIYSNYRGLVARYSDTQNYYYAYVSAYNGLFSIRRVVNGITSTLASGYVFQILGEDPPGHLQTGTPHRIRFRAEGSRLSLFLGDTELAVVEDSSFAAGKAGIYSGKAAHSIDDFSITVLEATGPEQPVVDPVREYVSQNSLILSGTKQPGTGIWIDGEMKIAPDAETFWEFPVTFPQVGDYTFQIQAGTPEQLLSAAVPVSVHYEPNGPGLYVDYFDTNSLGSGLDVLHGNWSVHDGALYQDYSTPDPRGWLKLSSPLATPDYELEADFHISSATSRTEKGFLARYQDENNYYYAYVEKLYAYRYFRIIKYVDGQFYQVGSTSQSYGNWVNKDYHLKLAVEGNTLNFFFDGSLVLSAQDASLAEGTAGLRSYRYGDKIDNFIAKAIGYTPAPVEKPVLFSPVPAYVNQSQIRLSGTNAAGTTVWLGETQAVQISPTEWEIDVTLQANGTQSMYEIIARDSFGNSSEPLFVSTMLDEELPAGSVEIAGGEDEVYDRSATVVFYASDALSGVDSMRYSFDGVTFTDWQPFSAQLNITLPGVEGSKTIFYEIKDKAGNISPRYTDNVELVLSRYFDDFSGASLNGDWNPKNGVFELNGERLYHAYHPSQAPLPSLLVLDKDYSTRNFDVSVDLAFGIGNSGDVMGIVSRYQDNENFYYASISAAGVYQIVRFLNGNREVIFSGTLAETPSQGIYHNVRFVSEGSRMQFYFNGMKLLDVYDSALRTGQNGLAADLFGNFFDNFNLIALPDTTVPVVTVNPVPEMVFNKMIRLSGLRTPGTSVWIDGSMAVPEGENEEWSYDIELPEDGPKEWIVIAKSPEGELSDSQTVSTVYLESDAVLYEDMFDNEGLGEQWLVEAGSWEQEGGTLVHDGPFTGAAAIVLDPAQFLLPAGDFDIAASFYFDQRYWVKRGLLLHYQDEDNFYRAEIWGNTACRLIKVVDGVETVLATGVVGTLNVGTYHDIGFSRNGDALQVFFNGNLVLQASDISFDGGTAGIYSSNSNVTSLPVDQFVIQKSPVTKPYVDSLPESVSSDTLTLSGYKAPGTSIWINGSEAVPASQSATWFYDLTSLEEGVHTDIRISARDLNGDESAIIFKSIYREVSDLPAFLMEKSMDYFLPEHGLVESGSGYPFEGWGRTGYTQPTAIGFYALTLSNVITGAVNPSALTAAEAIEALDKLMDSLLRDQAGFGYKGLLPWMGFDGQQWGPRTGTPEGSRVMTGDNVNLSAALGAAEGALLDPALEGNAEVAAIRSKIETFLEAQREGYFFLYDSSSGKIRRGYDVVNGSWVGGINAYHEVLADEFRSGILFAVLRFGLPETVYSSLAVSATAYDMADGRTVYSVTPYDGGAFQMLWPLLLMPEYDIPGFQNMHETFLEVAFDFVERNNLPGLLSASYIGTNQYAGNAGIQALSENPTPRNESTASLYTLGAAYQVDPVTAESLLRRILKEYPGLISSHGLWEGVDAAGRVIPEQIVANVTTFVLGLAGTGPEYMRRYLQHKDLYAHFQQIHPVSGVPVNLIQQHTFDYNFGGQGNYQYGLDKGAGKIALNGSDFTLFRRLYGENSLNISGRQLKIRYRSSSEPIHLELEFRKDTNAGSRPVFQVGGVELENTQGMETELTIDLLPMGGLTDIRSILISITGSGLPIDLEILALEVV